MKINWKKTNAAIAEDLGCSREKVRLMRIEEGIPPTPRGGKRPGAGAKPSTVAKISGVKADEKRAWHEAHKKEGLNFAQWCRKHLNEAAGID